MTKTEGTDAARYGTAVHELVEAKLKCEHEISAAMLKLFGAVSAARLVGVNIEDVAVQVEVDYLEHVNPYGQKDDSVRIYKADVIVGVCL